MFISTPNIALLDKRLETRPADLSKLRSIQTGGTALSDMLRKKIMKKVPSAQLYQTYGISDFGSVITIGNENSAVNSVGSLFYGVKAKVRKDNFFFFFKLLHHSVCTSSLVTTRHLVIEIKIFRM